MWNNRGSSSRIRIWLKVKPPGMAGMGTDVLMRKIPSEISSTRVFMGDLAGQALRAANQNKSY